MTALNRPLRVTNSLTEVSLSCYWNFGHRILMSSDSRNTFTTKPNHQWTNAYNPVNQNFWQYLTVQNTAVTQKLLQKTETSRHDTMGRQFASILRFSPGTDDRKHGNTSEPLEGQVDRCRRHSETVLYHSNSARTLKSWTNCWVACCSTATVNPSWARLSN